MTLNKSEKIRVAFFAEMLIADYDGAARTMFQLINRIDKERFEFLFICGQGPDTIQGFRCLRVPTITMPLNRNYIMTMPLLANRKLKEELARFAPQVVHIATPSYLGQFALKFARRHQLPVLSIYHTHFISYIDYYFARFRLLIRPVKAWIKTVQKLFYNRCKLIYIPSESIAAELKQSGVEASRMKIWKRGIDTSLFSPLKRSQAFVQNLTGNTQKNILFASRLVREKNLETLFQIYEVIQKQQLPYNLIIAGDGLARAECEKRMPTAVFTGNLPHGELSSLYASCDAFLFPSVSEAYGNVVLEAMASGLPCVIADGGGSRDFITPGENGYKCPPNDAAVYVEKLVEILENEAVSKRFITAGLEYSRRLDWNALANTYFTDISLLAQSTFFTLPLIPAFA